MFGTLKIPLIALSLFLTCVHASGVPDKFYGLAPLNGVSAAEDAWGIFSKTYVGSLMPAPRPDNEIVFAYFSWGQVYAVVLSKKEGGETVAELYLPTFSRDGISALKSLGEFSVPRTFYESACSLVYSEVNAANPAHTNFCSDGSDYFFGARNRLDSDWLFARANTPVPESRAWKISKIADDMRALLGGNETTREAGFRELESKCRSLRVMPISSEGGVPKVLDEVALDLEKSGLARFGFSGLKREVEEFGGKSALCNAYAEKLRKCSLSSSEAFELRKKFIEKKLLEFGFEFVEYSSLAGLRALNVHSCDGFWAILPYRIPTRENVDILLVVPKECGSVSGSSGCGRSKPKSPRAPYGTLLAQREVAEGVYLQLVEKDRK